MFGFRAHKSSTAPSVSLVAKLNYIPHILAQIAGRWNPSGEFFEGKEERGVYEAAQMT